MFKKILAGTAAGMIAAVGLAAPATAVTATTADVYVVHGIPATPVDVYVDGAELINNFQPGDVGGPVSLPTGQYDIELRAGDTDPSSPVILSAMDVQVNAGTSYTVIAHLNGSGDPAITAFVNDISKTPAGQGRLTAIHAADAPTVDVVAGGAVVFPAFDLGEAPAANIAPATIAGASVNLAGSASVALALPTVTVAEGANRIVIVYGSAEGESLAATTFEITGLHSTPGGVNSGEAGLAADPNPATIAWSIAGIMALLGAAVFAVARTRTVRAER